MSSRDVATWNHVEHESPCFTEAPRAIAAAAPFMMPARDTRAGCQKVFVFCYETMRTLSVLLCPSSAGRQKNVHDYMVALIPSF